MYSSGIAPDAQIANRHSTIEAILSESKRPGRTPVRHAFCQQGPRSNPRPGPLAGFVSRGREKALDQFLIGLTWASGGEHDVRKSSRIWARACGHSDNPSGRAAVSRAWAFMEELRLIERERIARLANVRYLKEDGSGEPYTNPGSEKNGETWLTLPFEYWTERYYNTLDLPAKAMLLIARDLPDGFPLPANRVPDWYGISTSTAERGLHKLRTLGLLRQERVQKAAPLTPDGYTIVNFYTLQAPFGPKKNATSR